MKKILLLLAVLILAVPFAARAEECPWDEMDYFLLTTQGTLLDRAENSSYSSTRKLKPEDVCYLTLRAMDALGEGEDWRSQALSGAQKYLETISFDSKTMTKETYARFLDAFVTRTWGQTEVQGRIPADLEAISPEAREAAKRMVALGIMTLTDDGRFQPAREMKGFDIAGMIYRLYQGQGRPVIDIEKTIMDAYMSGMKEVTIPAGSYHLKSKQGTHLLLNNLRCDEESPFIVHMEGVELIATDTSAMVLRMVNCKNIVVDGAIIRYITPLVTQGVVTDIALDGRVISVELDEGYPKLDTMTPTAYVFIPGTRDMKPGAPDLYAVSAVETESGRVDIAYDYDVRQRNVAIGDALGFRLSAPFAIQVSGCEQVTLSNVTVTEGLFAVHEDGGEGGNIYRNLVVTWPEPPEGAQKQRLMSTVADAIHSDFTRKGPLVIGCRFEGMGDDCFNIHGGYAMLVERTAEDELVLASVGMPIFDRVGDRIRMQDMNGTLLWEGVVTEILDANLQGYAMAEALQDVNPHFTATTYQRIRVDGVPAFVFGAMTSNPDRGGRGFQLIDNVFGPNRARGVLVKADDGVIRNNRFTGNSIHSLLIAPEFYWNESGYVRNLLVENNVFEKSGFVFGYPATVVVDGEGGTQGAAAHQGITFAGNVFRDNYGYDISLTHASNVVLKNNQFLPGAEHARKQPHIRIQYCKNVALEENLFDSTRAPWSLGEQIDGIALQAIE